ncbi:MAG: hypothetical protein HYZ68_01065 [Chloroflexi bacterium]|nr:hypothetical protein [Chloroflexota bacterium]
MRSLQFALLIGMVAGTAIGLSTAWLIFPSPLANAKWAQLREEHKRDLVAMIAAAYAVDGNLTVAQARLFRLGLSDLRATLSEQAGGDPASARLAAALFPETAPSPATVPSPSSVQATPTRSAVARSSPTTAARPTATPREARYRLAEALDLGCSADHPQDAIAIYVRASDGQGLPWVAIRLGGPRGEDLFYTGLRPQVDPGYADYLVTAYGSYEIGLADEEQNASAKLRFEGCLSEDGEQHRVWRVIFEREP